MTYFAVYNKDTNEINISAIYFSNTNPPNDISTLRALPDFVGI